MVKILLSVILAAVASVSFSDDFALTKDGRPCSVIVLPEKAGPVELHAARELSTYLGKISGGEPTPIVNEPSKDLYNIHIGTVADKKLSAMVDSKLSGVLTGEGVVISADKRGLVIWGKEPIGVLYGVYDVLKRHGGIRWLVPEDDGEYFKTKPSISVPEEAVVRNPSFAVRTLFFGTANINSPMWGTYDWMVRNNMRIENFSYVLEMAHLREKLAERGAVSRDGLHSFGDLLNGRWVKTKSYAQGEENIKRMFLEHPDRFPLINGRRMPLENHKYQPCTSNPDVMDVMFENLSLWVEKRIHPGGYYVVGNEDGTGWCQCGECSKLDPSDEKELGFVSTRYWTYVDKLIKKVWEKHPDARLWGWAYQNFQQPPSGIVPDKRIHVMQVYNRRCYRHRLTDPNCPANKVFLEYFKGWSKLGNPTSTWEQIDSSAFSYMPIEETFIDSIRTYHKLKVNGVMPVVAPIGQYQKHFEGTLHPLNWYCMWQTLYMSAQFLWDVDSDYAKLYEEANSLYYGAAWNAGMRDFRALLIKAASETPGCYGWGHDGSPVGRCLDQPGVHEKLLAHLSGAEEAVKDDPRSLAHVLRDRMLFARTWEKARKEYLENYREVKAYRASAGITIDARLDEPDWKNADIVSNFKTNPSSLAKFQTFARVTYAPEFLYFAIEAMEPEPGKILSHATGHDGEVWNDNSLELFISHPDLGNNYYHLIFNAKGVLYDASNSEGQKTADKSFSSNAEIKTAVLGDRWVAEVKIPTAALGMKSFDGHVWKINIARSRMLDDKTLETSSWSGGNFHGVNGFLPVSFAGKRTITANSFIEQDSRLWKNGSFNEATKATPSWKGWTLGENGLVPKSWIPHGANGALEMSLRGDGQSNYFAKISDGCIFQLFHGTEPALKINFSAAGKGKLRVVVFRYERNQKMDDPLKFISSDIVDEVDVDSDTWKGFKLDYPKKNADEVVALALWHLSGEVWLDDVYLMGDDAAGRRD